MTGKEFRKALETKFKELGIDDKEITISSIGHFMWLSEGSLSKKVDEAYKKAKATNGTTMWDVVENIRNQEDIDYCFYLNDGEDANSMYVKVEKKI